MAITMTTHVTMTIFLFLLNCIWNWNRYTTVKFTSNFTTYVSSKRKYISELMKELKLRKDIDGLR